jgi:hypothetical protein
VKSIGPSNITTTRQCCGLCIHHYSVMIRSGRHPAYNHYCRHEESIEVMRESVKRTGRTLCEPGDGRMIGESDTTPHWCPVSPSREVRHGTT